MKLFDKSGINFLNKRYEIVNEFKSQKEAINKILINDQISSKHYNELL